MSVALHTVIKRREDVVNFEIREDKEKYMDVQHILYPPLKSKIRFKKETLNTKFHTNQF